MMIDYSLLRLWSVSTLQAWIGEDTFVFGSKSNDLSMVDVRSKRVTHVPLPERIVNFWEVSSFGQWSSEPVASPA